MTRRPVPVAAAGLLVLGLLAVAPAGATAGPTPTLTPGSGVDPADAVILPVEEVTAGSEDLIFAEASADGAVTDRGGREFILAADVLFAFNRATLTARARTEIARIARVLTSSSGPGPKVTSVTVTGYTDDIGRDLYNLGLSRRRALAVRAELVKALDSGVAVVAVGRGEQDPVATNKTERGRRDNRRVEIRGR